MNYLLSNYKLLALYLLLVSSIPYLILIMSVNNSLSLAIPYLFSSTLIFIGSNLGLPIKLWRYSQPLSIKEPIFYSLIAGIAFVELLAAGNLPAISLFIGPYVSHVSYGIPLVHSLFNGICFFYVVSIFTLPSLTADRPKMIQVFRCTSICLYILLTFQRLPFVLLLVSLLLPKILATLLIFKRVFCQALFPKRLLAPISLLLIFMSALMSIGYIGSIRNDLSSLTFQGFGSYTYNTFFASLPPYIQIPLQYLFSPILNAHNNIDLVNSSSIYLLQQSSPYLAPAILYIFQYTEPQSFYLANPIFNAISQSTLLFHIFPFGFILFSLYSIAMGILVSKRFLLINTSDSLNNSVFLVNDINATMSLICIVGFSLGFFIPWYSYPMVIISIVLSMFVRLQR